MKTYTRLVLACLSVGFISTQAMAQDKPDKPPKPPKFPKSDNHGPKSNGSELAGGAAADIWILMVPEVCDALASGKLETADDKPLSKEAQAEVLVILQGSDKAGSCPTRKPSRASSTPAARLAATAAPQRTYATTGGGSEGRSDVLSNLTAAGAPQDKASALLAALSGILGAPVKSQLAECVDRFNELVVAAPDSFLANPPADFLAIHGVLARLLRVDKPD